MNVLHPSLRRIFMRVQPEYFSLPVEEQERYRVNMPERDRFLFRQALMRGLFGIQVKTEGGLDSAREDFGDEEHLAWNCALLPLNGIGEDHFHLLEYCGAGKTLLDFPTVHDFDSQDHAFQEEARQEQWPEYVIKAYRGALHHEWARLFIDGEFHYATLSMAAAHIYSKLEDFGDKRLAALLPHRYVKGKDDGKRESGGTILSRRMEAGGMERHVEELQHRLGTYLSDRYEALLTEFDEQGRKAVYMVDQSRDNDPHVHFLFTDRTALQAVRFRHFVSDCRLLAATEEELEPILLRERQALTERMESAYRDILVNFNPKIAPLRKKNKILVADGALRDLLGP